MSVALQRVALAQTSYQWMNPSPGSFRAAMDGPVLHSHRWALLGVLFSKAILGQGLLSQLSQRNLATLSKRFFWSSQLCSSTSISASPLLRAVLGHVCSSGHKCEVVGDQKPAFPQLTVLPGCELCQGNTFGVAIPGTCPPQPLLQPHIQSPGVCICLSGAVITLQGWRQLWSSSGLVSCQLMKGLSCVGLPRLCLGFPRQRWMCVTSVVGGSVVTARMI